MSDDYCLDSSFYWIVLTVSQGFEPRFIINTLVNNDSPIEGRKIHL